MAKPEQPKRRGRPPAKVKAGTAGARLRELRENANLSQDALGEIVGVDRSMIAKYEVGKHDMGPEVLQRSATRFNVTPSYILFGEEVIYARRTAELLGDVGAGQPIEAVQRTNPELIEVPSQLEDAIAFRVSGASCEPIFEDGDIVIVHKAKPDPAGFVHRFCVVQTKDGKGYLKRVERGEDVPGLGHQYRLLGAEAAGDVPSAFIDWARPVVMRILGGGR